MRTRTITFASALGTVIAVGAAHADTYVYEDTGQPSMYRYAWSEPRLESGIGVGLNLGGGVAGFTDQSVRNALNSNLAGLWDARLSLGTHIPLGLDVSYLGQAVDLASFRGTSNGTLIGTTVEAAVRFNLAPHMDVNPYIFAGAGWQHYDVMNARFATSDTGIANGEDIAEYPMGVGLSYRDISGLTFDLRGTFRAVPSSNLVADVGTTTHASLHWWEASGSLGYEF